MPSDKLDFRNRAELFQTLEQTQYDLLIIGAGITGCGVAREAAMRGLKVALVDSHDIAAGTSSRSSKLVHGGMRYMAAGQLTVVKEASIERKTLRRIAPHLAQTTRMLLPAPNIAASLKFKTAMLAYEKLGEVEPENRHQVWDLETLRENEPEIDTDRLRSAVVYPEYVTDDARLTLANARSAKAAGAHIITYAPVTQILTENRSAVGVIVSDSLGEQGACINARMIVNAAGPWLDAVRALEDNQALPLLQLTKGIHVTLRRDRLPINSTVILQAADKRSNFVVPRGEYVYFGTTDTFYPDADYWPGITHEDIDYLLDSGRKTFNSAPFNDEDIVSVWSGVRPLLAQRGKKPSEISRKNEFLQGPGGVLSIAGGKLTSYRSMAERIVDLCAKNLGINTHPSTTAEDPLPGGDFDGDLAPIEAALSSKGLSPAQSERGARLYGSEAAGVFSGNDTLQAEIDQAVLAEGALTLEDVWVRRTSRARFSENGGLDDLEAMATHMGTLMNWSDPERQTQLDNCREIHRNERSVFQPQGT
ncbi:MAG: glycerol-3-phosphate dehydrogenase/oxidase [Candidatus Hydrogenedentota bacterium]